MRHSVPFALVLLTLPALGGADCQRTPPEPDAGPEEVRDSGPPRVPDETPPEVTFLEPEEDCLEGEVVFRFRVEDEGEGVAFVSAKFAARTLTLEEEEEGLYSATFDVGLLSTGARPLIVTATDRENNVTEAERLYGVAREGEYLLEGELECGDPPPVIVDEAPPTVELLTPSPNLPAHANTSLEVTALVSDDVGPVTARATLQHLELELEPDVVSESATRFHGTFDLTSIAEGEHELEVIATDAAGHSTSVTRTITVDRTAPVVSIIEPLAGEERVAFTDVVAVITEENIVVVRLYEVGNEVPLASISSPSDEGVWGLIYRLTCDNLPRETTFDVRALDRAGNMGSDTVDVTVNAIGCGP